MLHFHPLRKTTGSVDCKTVRIFAYSSTREKSNKRSETRLKTESDTLYRFLYWFWGKKPTVLQSNGGDSLTLTKCIAKCLYRDDLPGNLDTITGQECKSPLPVAVRSSKTPLLTGDVKMYVVSQNKNVTSVRRRRVCLQWFDHTLMSCV